MSNILKYKSVVAVCLCFIFVFSFFALTFQRSEAIATIPLVAVPIIKLLIASGVTFLSVDAMLEVYNQIKGTTYYNTLTGNILNVLDDLSEDLVSSWLFHDWAMQQPDPPGSGWPELLLGTLCLEIAKSDSFFQDFLNWFNGFKDDLSDDEMIFGDNVMLNEVDDLNETLLEIRYDYDLYHRESCMISGYLHGYGGTGVFISASDSPDGKSRTYLYTTDGFVKSVEGGGSMGKFSVSAYPQLGWYDVYFNSTGWNGGMQLSQRIYVDNENNSLDNDPMYPLHFPDFPEEERIIIDEDNNFQNDYDEKVEIYVPIPNEIITYDPDEGLDIDFDTEISIEEFTELMTPYVGSTWEDIQQDKPIPSKVPTDVPYPDDPVVPDPVVLPAPVPDEDDLPPDADEGDDPFTGADEGKTIDWDPLKGIGLHKKFPFCVPWDLYDSFKTFNVEGEAPCWKVEFLHDTEFTIDFSIFEPWAVIVRWGILILFNLGLILVTRNLIRG